jgi:hypothetical protein
MPMAEKYAVLIKYKYLEYIDNAKLSDTDAWTFMKSIIEYDKTGTEPLYSNPVLSGLFAVVKIDLDKNRENYENVSQERSKAGKEGAKKRWRKAKNSKDGKGHDDIAKIANANDDSNCHDLPKKHGKNSKMPFCQKNMAKMHDLDLGSEFVKESGGSKIYLPDFPEKPDVFPAEKNQPPPQIIELIISEAQKAGFIIDTKKALEFYRSGIDLSWYEGSYSFFAFAAQKVRTGKYANKPPDEQKNLFINAVVSWENLRTEYPLWLENRKKEDVETANKEARERADAESKAKIQRAMEALPKTCTCGKPLDEMLFCLDCKLSYEFDETFMEYRSKPMSAFAIEYARKKRKETRGPGS